MIRIALLPLILLLSALSFVRQSVAPDDLLDAERSRNFFGWLAPQMEAHWARLFNRQHHQYGSFNHSAKNVLAEWVALDPQRAGKAFSFVVCVLAAALVLVVMLK